MSGTPSLPTIEQMIALVEHEADDNPIAQLTTAAGIKARVEHLGDELLDHFVGHARSAGCSWNDIGEALGVSRQAAHQRHGGLLGNALDKFRGGAFTRFTPRARAAVIAAQTAAREFGHTPVGTEHVLLGIYADGDSDVGVRALERLGVERSAVEAFITAARAPGGNAPRGHIRFGADAKAALEGALQAALELGHDHIGCEHLLLGIVRQSDSLGGRALAAQGVTAARLATAVDELLGEAR